MESIIRDKLKEKKLADSSIELYINNLKKLNNGEPLKNFRFLSKIDTINEKMKLLKLTTKRNYLITIVSILNCFYDNKQIKNICDKYYLLMKKTSQEIKQTPSGEKSETQKKNWIEWNEVVKVWEKLNEYAILISKKKTISEEQYNNLLAYIVLSLYVQFVPRRNMDWQLMNIKYSVSTSDDTKKNYYDYISQKLIFNNYKTQKTHKQQVYDIPEGLNNSLKLYFKHHPILKNKITQTTNTPLLVYYDGSQLNAVNSITRILNKIFNKQVGSSLLRHIFLSDKYGKENVEREEIADAMGHTVQTQQEYIKNDNKKNDIIINFD